MKFYSLWCPEQYDRPIKRRWKSKQEAIQVASELVLDGKYTRLHVMSAVAVVEQERPPVVVRKL
jgi:hypothetical protein